MTGFRNFVLSCALAAASIIPPVAPAAAMPRPALDIALNAPADVQYARHRDHYRGWRHGYYPRFGHRHRRSGISIYFGPSLGYFPEHRFYGNRYYFGPRYYGPGYYPGYYPYRHHRAYYPHRYYRPDYYGHRYHRSGHFGIYIQRGW